MTNFEVKTRLKENDIELSSDEIDHITELYNLNTVPNNPTDYDFLDYCINVVVG